ncbi:UNVERIFIED_CONTAM: hypothetical protein Slati_3106200 [Sesamum latifolium]|uniref:Uncharacterized protein n=1 Tax=Sesamum latifolium TaxID=2727402 RepID=A0AAW2UV83_9LAMI
MADISRKFGFSMIIWNQNNKIWGHFDDNFEVEVNADDEQFLHLKCIVVGLNAPIYCYIVYSKCNKVARECIWNFMRLVADQGGQWMICRDFNMVLSTNKCSNGTYPTHHSIEEFRKVIFDCGLLDVGFDGSAYTWTYHRLWQRLDRVLFSGEWVDNFPLTKVTHLSRFSSDHCPLLLQLWSTSKTSPSSFRFQNMWCHHVSFQDMLFSCWDAPIGVGGMLKLKMKLKRLKLWLKQ